MVAAPVPLQARDTFAPPKPASVEETNLDVSFITDLALKVIYFNGVVTGGTVAAIMCLPYNNVVDRVLETLKTHSLVEIRGELRKEKTLALADKLRDALKEGGIVIEDTPDGPRGSYQPVA